MEIIQAWTQIQTWSKWSNTIWKEKKGKKIKENKRTAVRTQMEHLEGNMNMVWFVHFDLAMCLAQQHRALFRHLNFQKCSKRGVARTFWLGHAFRAKKACTFSTSQLPKVLQTDRHAVVCTFRRCALRHNGVQLSISYLARWLRTRRFSEPTFRPSGATNHWHGKTRSFATFLPFRAPGSSFFRRSLLWSSLGFSSLLWLFSSICRKFDFKTSLKHLTERGMAKLHEKKSICVDLGSYFLSQLQKVKCAIWSIFGWAWSVNLFVCSHDHAPQDPEN